MSERCDNVVVEGCTVEQITPPGYTPPSTVAALVEALDGLLADTQHATHDCGDEDCPVRRARAALALYRGEVA